MRFFSAVLPWLLIVAHVPPAQAQVPREGLTACWTLGPPYYELSDDGGHGGFFIAFTRVIAEELGLPLKIVPRGSFSECARAQQSGLVNIVAGAGDFDVFEENNLFSRPMGLARHRVFVRTGNRKTIDPLTATGMKVVVWDRHISPEATRFAARNTLVPIDTPGDAMFSLLSGDVDAILFPEGSVQVWSRRAGMDHRIVPVGPPFAQYNRVVVLNKRLGHLMAPIERIIAEMEADGRLADLFRRFGISSTPPAPEVLRVAVPQADATNPPTPYVSRDAEGGLTGFAIEVFRDLAALAEIEFDFVEVPYQDMLAGPRPGAFDISPMIAISEARRDVLDYTLPIEQFSVAALVRVEDRLALDAPGALKGRRLGVLPNTIAARQAAREEALDAVAFDSADGLLLALLAGEIDAALETGQQLSQLAEDRGLGARVVNLAEPVFASQRAVALRPGLGVIRERLNAVIPGYLLSPEYAARRQQFLGPAVFWTDPRKRLALVAGALLSLGLLVTGVALLLSNRARREAVLAHGEAEAKTSEALELSTRLEAVMNAAQSGILALVRKGERLAVVNERARDLLGLGEGATPIDWPPDLLFLDRRTGLPLRDDDCPMGRAQAGEILDGEVFFLSRPGHKGVRHIQVASAPLPVEASPDIAAVVILHDVTEQDLDRERAETAERLSAVGQLTGGVAHDFNNLLAVVLGNQELLRETLHDKEERALVDNTIAATERGASLVRSMLAFARKARLAPQAIDINAVVRDTAGWIERTLPANITVRMTLDPALWSTLADPGATESALLNLILNARDAMAEGGTLTISTQNLPLRASRPAGDWPGVPHGAYVVLTVSDTGTGIAPAVRKRIFEPFFTTKSPGKGSGLGLSMVQGFMAQSGGVLHLASEPGEGTQVQLLFRAETAATEATPEEAPRAPAGPQVKPRILLVEDEPQVRKVLRALLEHAGFEVTGCADGPSALALFQADRDFGLLLTDIMMPGGLLGTGLAREIRRLAPGLPVVFLTGYAEDAPGGAPVLPNAPRVMKPASREALFAAIDRALASTGTDVQ